MLAQAFLKLRNIHSVGRCVVLHAQCRCGACRLPGQDCRRDDPGYLPRIAF